MFFSDSKKFNIKRGRKVKVDTISYFFEIITSSVWISNSSLDKGIGLKTSKILAVNTFYGTPIKKFTELIKVIPNIKLLLAGNGSYKDVLENKVKENGIADKVVF